MSPLMKITGCRPFKELSMLKEHCPKMISKKKQLFSFHKINFEAPIQVYKTSSEVGVL